MTTELDSLAMDSGTSLDDLVSTPNQAEMPVSNKGTASSMAAHAAMLVGPEDAVDVYENVYREVGDNSGYTPTYDNVITSANQREASLTIEQMGSILGDENIPLDQKVGYASQWRTGSIQPDRARSPQELVAINQLEKDGLVEDSAEVDDTRWSLAANLGKVNDYNSSIQKMVNQEDLANSPGILEAGKNFIEAVSPFLDQAQVAEIQTRLRNSQDQGDFNSLASGIVKSFGLLGESKEEIRNFVSKVPVESRLPIAQAVYDVVLASEGSILGDKNSMVVMDNLRNFLVEGHYTTGDRVIDDISSALDLIGIGASVRAVKSGIRSAGNAARITKRNAMSAGEVVAQTNSKSANALIKAVANDETGELAQNVYGSTKSDVLVNSIGPEIGLPDKSVRAKPSINTSDIDADADIVRQIAGREGDISYTKAEKQSKFDDVSKDFLNLDFSGVTVRREMTSITNVDDVDGGVNIRTVIGPVDGGFKNGLDGVEQVKLATRKYGILDSEITLLKRSPEGNYKQVDINSPEAKVDGDYLVGVETTTPYDPSDLISWSTTDVKGKLFGIPLNIFDRITPLTRGKGGSVTQHLIPPSAIIDPLLTRSASVAVDNSAKSVDLLFQMASKWGEKYNGLKTHQKNVIDNYILRANHDGLKFNPEALEAEGWSPNMIDAYRQWKRTNDTIYELENIDVVRTSKRKGFEMFVTADGQDSVVVKPITNSVAGNLGVTKVYDPEIGMIRNITSAEKTELYKNGGTIAMARTPVNVGNETISYIKVSNNQSNYTRALRESDRILNYRDGHFTIYYKDPVFITKKVKNADGTEYTKAIATSKNIKDAEAYLKRVRAAEPDGVFTMRSDLKGEEFDEMMWNARVNSGRTAQRTRGEMLEDASARPTDMEFRHIATPEESLIRSITSISRRVNMKEWVDVAKARFMNQYDEYLPRHPTTHAKYWPDNVKQLVKPDSLEGNVSDYADAVSTFRYIDQMESGFINLIDDFTKNLFKAIADTSGKKGFSYLETGARVLQSGAPTAWARKKAFRLLLASAPIRQFVVQSSQALPVILATNPTFIPKVAPYIYLMRYLDRGGDSETFVKVMGKNFGISAKDALTMEKAYKESGIASAVSAHSLIRDDLKSLVNRTPLQKARAALGKPLDFTQKIGFEAGENILMKAIWISEYDLLRKSGKEINKEALNLLHARVRDLSLNMNKAGELAYNENTFSAMMQFMQAPHKAFAQIVLGNRALSRADRLKLGTAYIATYGTGFGLIFDQVLTPLLGDLDNETRDVIVGGLFNVGMNKALSLVYGEDVDTDFSSSMRLLEIPNLGEMFQTLATMDMESIVTSSPSVSLVVGDNARVNNVVKSLYRFFTVPEDDGSLKDVGYNFLNMFSGASAVFKADYALEKGRSINTRGEVLDKDVNPVEALMKVAGFQTVDEMLSFQVNKEIYYNSKKFKDDVKYLMDETSRRLAREGISEKERDYVLRLYQEANRVYAKEPRAMNVVRDEIRRRIRAGDHIIINALIDQAGIVTENQFNEMLNKAPLDNSTKDKIRNIHNSLKE